MMMMRMITMITMIMITSYDISRLQYLNCKYRSSYNVTEMLLDSRKNLSRRDFATVITTGENGAFS